MPNRSGNIEILLILLILLACLLQHCSCKTIVLVIIFVNPAVCACYHTDPQYNDPMILILTFVCVCLCMFKVTYTDIQYVFYVLRLNFCVTAIFTYIYYYLPRVYICVVVAQSVENWVFKQKAEMPGHFWSTDQGIHEQGTYPQMLTQGLCIELSHSGVQSRKKYKERKYTCVWVSVCSIYIFNIGLMYYCTFNEINNIYICLPPQEPFQEVSNKERERG